MTTAPSPSGPRPDCTKVVADYSRHARDLELEALRMRLAMLQFRLGTLAEIPCDPERAQVLRAEINQRSNPVTPKRDHPPRGPSAPYQS